VDVTTQSVSEIVNSKCFYQTTGKVWWLMGNPDIVLLLDSNSLL
jgi:hypothetical protein